MAFIKPKIIYQSDTTKVYINQCHNHGKKTKLFTVRKDDNTGIANCIGTIRWHGTWLQYVFFPDSLTFWNWKCLFEISRFVMHLNLKHINKRRKLK